MTEDKLYFTQENRSITTIGVIPDIIREVEVGDFVLVSHFAGIGSSGFEAEPMRVIGVGLSLKGQGFIGKLICVDTSQDLVSRLDLRITLTTRFLAPMALLGGDSPGPQVRER